MGGGSPVAGRGLRVTDIQEGLMLESHIEKTVCSHARKLGWLVFKFVSPGVRGVPDRIFIKHGSLLFIEFKAPKKKPNRLQVWIHDQLESHGFPVYVIDDIDAGKELVDAHTR